MLKWTQKFLMMNNFLFSHRNDHIIKKVIVISYFSRLFFQLSIFPLSFISSFVYLSICIFFHMYFTYCSYLSFFFVDVYS